ncbi:50S ribosomal protein L17 [Blattabacterium cuenoti]|nr:50S ribosomal protein L17 [Blattabacterium cuenoti]
MNHGDKNNNLKRKYGHRNSLLSNMASSLIKEKRIFTTLAKAKSLRKYIEPIITKSKLKSTHSMRKVFSYLRDKNAVAELFKKDFDQVRKRPGGYTRILKIGSCIGKYSRFSLIELVDFNKIYNPNKKYHTRRGRKKKRNQEEKKMSNEQNKIHKSKTNIRF